MMIKIRLSSPRKGITLVEVIVTLSIMAVLLLFVIPINSKFNEIREEKLKEDTKVYLQNFIINSQKYSRENNITGRVIGHLGGNEFYFAEGINIITKYTLPEGYSIRSQGYGPGSTNDAIEISSNGRFKLSGYTQIMDKDKNRFKIIINFQKNTVRIEDM